MRQTARRSHRIEGHGGVGLHVADTGPETAPPILLIHGWSQHHLSWAKQLGGPLAERFRLIAPDLRGHGASDKPDAPEAYDNSAPWAGDIAAIIWSLGLERPVVVGWSMGGWVLFDYIRVHGDAALGGIVVTGAGVRSGKLAAPELQRRHRDVEAIGMYSPDQGAQIAAAIAFVKACVASPLSKTDLAFMVGLNMLVPPHVRRACRLRHEDYRRDLAHLAVPALVIQGQAERLCLKPAFEEVVETIRGAEALSYPGAGHAPFWEAPERFDADLAAFAARCHGVAA